ncbi:MAG TPA: lipoyl synthase [Gemmatimonadaceae bacterium]|nr:lipoyl synthase [Gemmatimonadaceae bacterium]
MSDPGRPAPSPIPLSLPSDRRVKAGEKRKPLRAYERLTDAPPAPRRPDWLRARIPTGKAYLETKEILRTLDLHTVCESANCPNIGDCFSRHTATFLILGNVCTRACPFCDIRNGKPLPVDPDEPARVADASKRLGLRYVVVTSVNRDELPDGGAGHFAATIRALKEAIPSVRVEVLIPDFMGNEDALRTVLEAKPDVLNHNMETVKRLYKRVRPAGRYDRSLTLLRNVTRFAPEIPAKSGLMVGVGETRVEVEELIRDLHAHGVSTITIGQYLAPSNAHLPVERYVAPEEFAHYREYGLALGVRQVASAPLVRSSFHAEEQAGETVWVG